MYLILLKQIVEQIKIYDKERNNKEIIKLKLSNYLLNKLSKRKKLFRLKYRKGPISVELANFLKIDPKTKLSCSETVRLIWKYIRDNDLQCPYRKIDFYIDNKLSNLFDKNSYYFYQTTFNNTSSLCYISGYITQHFKILKK